MEPKKPKSMVLSPEEEALVVAFRKHTLLPLDDCLYALRETIQHLTRSSLHRLLQWHVISRLPEENGEKEPRKKCKSYPIGYFHIDITEVRTEEGKLYLFVAIDRTCTFAVAKLYDRATMKSARDFLEELIRLVPYQIHTVLTDTQATLKSFGYIFNRLQFSKRLKTLNGLTPFQFIVDKVLVTMNIS